MRTVKVRNGGDIAADRTPGKAGIFQWNIAGGFAAFSPERPVCNLLDEEKEELILGYCIAVTVLLALAKVLKLPLFRLVRRGCVS